MLCTINASTRRCVDTSSAEAVLCVQAQLARAAPAYKKADTLWTPGNRTRLSCLRVWLEGIHLAVQGSFLLRYCLPPDAPFLSFCCTSFKRKRLKQTCTIFRTLRFGLLLTRYKQWLSRACWQLCIRRTRRRSNSSSLSQISAACPRSCSSSGILTRTVTVECHHKSSQPA